jgi:hypothetical protein
MSARRDVPKQIDKTAESNGFHVEINKWAAIVAVIALLIIAAALFVPSEVPIERLISLWDKVKLI